VIDIAVALVEHTDTIADCHHIPSLLCEALGIDFVTLAVARTSKVSSDLQFVLYCDAYDFDANESQAAARENIRYIYHQLQPLLQHGLNKSCQSFYARNIDQPFIELDCNGLSICSRVIAFTRMIDEFHRMFLVFHWRTAEAARTAFLDGNLSVVALAVSKQLRSPVTCSESPWALGDAFKLLTPQESKILVGLNSELSEKEIAALFNMRPHTLHSHIKSIYRKVRVKGRISLLFRLRAALHRMRRDSLALPVKITLVGTM
jgi:DNA-binding CsgD family transcriptional regulator